LDLDENAQVLNFREKPQSDGWINAGFFVFEPEIFKYLSEDSVLEQTPLSRLAMENELMAYKHEGFWQPMDTYRESQELNNLWDGGTPPWKMWN
jgi:glucose-1-phosphate cytidylyltransferase